MSKEVQSIVNELETKFSEKTDELRELKKEVGVPSSAIDSLCTELDNIDKLITYYNGNVRINKIITHLLQSGVDANSINTHYKFIKLHRKNLYAVVYSCTSNPSTVIYEVCDTPNAIIKLINVLH